jgi:hypothetical protein
VPVRQGDAVNSQAGDTYIELQVQSALIEVNRGFTGAGLIGELSDVARRLIAALDDRDIELRPRGGNGVGPGR